MTGDLRGHRFEYKSDAAGGFEITRLLEKLRCGPCGLALYHAGELKGRLRLEAEVPDYGRTHLYERSYRRQSRWSRPFKLHTVSTRPYQFRSVVCRLFRACVAPERQVGDDGDLGSPRLLDPPRHGSRVTQHIIHRNGEEVVVAQHRVPHGIADEETIHPGLR